MFARTKSDVCLWGCAMGLAALMIGAMTGPASAGLLTTDPDSCVHGAAAITLGVDWDDDGIMDDYPITGSVEYAVYQGSAPLLSLDYSGKYIYAYQLFSDASSEVNAHALSVGVYGSQEMVEQTGYIPDNSAVAPTSITWSTGAQSVIWEFSQTYDGGVPPGAHSTILYFVSPYGPGTNTATWLGGGAATVDGIPSPVSEPATGVLTIIGALALLSTGVARRVRGKNRVAP